MGCKMDVGLSDSDGHLVGAEFHGKGWICL